MRNSFKLFAILALALPMHVGAKDKWTVENEDQSIKWKAQPKTLMTKGNVNYLLFDIIGPRLDENVEWLFTATCGLNGGHVKAYATDGHLLDVSIWKRDGETVMDGIGQLICKRVVERDATAWDTTS